MSVCFFFVVVCLFVFFFFLQGQNTERTLVISWSLMGSTCALFDMEELEEVYRMHYKLLIKGLQQNANCSSQNFTG